MQYIKRYFLIFISLVLFSGFNPGTFHDFVNKFIKDYEHLRIPGFTFDYREYFSAIPASDNLETQFQFFETKEAELKMYNREELKESERVLYDNIAYEVKFNLERISLEKDWLKGGRKVPLGGIHELPDFKKWHAFFIKKYTSLELSPEAVYDLGKREMTRVKAEIKTLQDQLGFKDSVSFYSYLKDKRFYLTEKTKVIDGFSRIDSTVRKNLPKFAGAVDVPKIHAMEWSDAGPNTPPGIYLSELDNPFGKHVFQFNFYGGKFNTRMMEWLYMHEAIPGHHLQFSVRAMYKTSSALSDLFLYPGNFEGWACYVEYFGKDVGLFSDPYSYLGKWEWDLVRSARLVLDVGIHYYGWSHEDAIKFWKANIPGQDEIAEREVTRVTNWVGQTVSYKAGADFIFKLKDKWLERNPGKTAAEFHHLYLKMGRVPLPVIEKNIL